MGSFGYLCKYCRTSVRGDSLSGGEKTIMIHVIHGKEIGRVEGHYDEFGRVIEQECLPEDEKFRGNSEGVNGHKQICSSEFDMDDSYYKIEKLRVYKGEEYNYFDFIRKRMEEDIEKYESDITQSHFFKHLNKDRKKLIVKYLGLGDINNANTLFVSGNHDFGYIKTIREYDIFHRELPLPAMDHYSGLVVWHSACYKDATEDERNDLTPSETDPDQSWGKVRKKFC